MSRIPGSKNRVIHIWSEEEKEYIREITPGHNYKEIVDSMNEKFNLHLTRSQIKGALRRYKLSTGLDGQFKKGNIPFNKGKKGTGGWGPTQFKKGNKPHNYLPVGSERISTEGYIEIKIEDPNKWKGKHILNWEEKNGPVPKGHVIIFGDGNQMNTELSNLILVSRKQLLVLNRNKLIKNDADLTRTGVIIADLYSKISEIKSKSNSDVI